MTETEFRRWDVGDGHILIWTDQHFRFEHDCDRRHDVGRVIRVAPNLDRHVVRVLTDGPTVSPSILCGDCKTHGFVVAGEWRSV